MHLSQNRTFFFFAISGQRWGCGKKASPLSSGSPMMAQAADVSTSKMAERPPNHRRWPFKAVGQRQKKICLRLACPPLPPLPCVPRQIPTYPLNAIYDYFLLGPNNNAKSEFPRFADGSFPRATPALQRFAYMIERLHFFKLFVPAKYHDKSYQIWQAW